MAQATLQEMTREIHLYSGEVCPFLMAQRWIRDSYRKILRRNIWSFKLGQGQFSTATAYTTGTVTMTNASATVTGSGTTFAAAHVGRQLKVSNVVFTVIAVGSGTSLTIDRNWNGATTAGLSYSILTAYITPTDQDLASNYIFKNFYSCVDPASDTSIAVGETVVYLDVIDPNRNATAGDPFLCLRGGDPGNVTAALAGVPQYELWPHVTTQKQYPYVFEKIMPDLAAATDKPNEIIRSDVIVKGALCDLVRWAGTTEYKNPMYDPTLIQYKNRQEEFEQEVAALIEADLSRVKTVMDSYNNRWSGIGS